MARFFNMTIEEDVDKILMHQWYWGMTILMRMEWHPHFNMRSKPMTKQHAWPKLLGLSLKC